jgi:Mlc titration factor MtfA (ptsG expression regulator)/transglutaminase-like putative cysteine protease
MPLTAGSLAWTLGVFILGVLLHIDRVPVWASVAAFGCAGLRMASALRPGRFHLPNRWLRVALTLVLVLLVLIFFRTLNGLAAGTALLVVMGSAKTLEVLRRRDQYIVIGAALFLLLAACLDRQSLLRAPLYLLHAFLCCTALAIAAHPRATLSARAAAGLTARSLLYAMPLAVLLFVFFPRLPGSFWALPRTSAAVTGLGEEMSPGSITELSESDEVAFRVWFQGRPPPPQQRYWRGPVLHDFDGYTWRRAPGRSYRQNRIEYLGPAYRYRIVLEPNPSQVWFALDTVTASPHRQVYLTYDYLLTSAQPVQQATTYQAVSHTQTRSLDPLSPLARRYDTRLPSGRNQRSAELAQRLRAGAGSDLAFTRAVLDHFARGGFEYTLTPPRLDFDSVDDFVFNTRRGFCGHFASAFVSMMRAGGVPARVVTGYLGGEWNPIGGYFIVRQSDAHAWAEVWIDGSGWMRFDPTGVVAPERLQRGILDLLPDAANAPTRLMHRTAWIAGVMHAWDAAQAWWSDRVVKFNLGTQLELLSRIGVDDPGWRQLGWALVAGLIAWLAWMAVQFGRLPRARLEPLSRAYRQLCDKLARAGVTRQPHVGPLDFARSVQSQRPDLAARIHPLLRRYAQLRYGPGPVTGQDVEAFARDVRRVRLPARGKRFPPEWRTLLQSSLPVWRRMPEDLRLQLEPVVCRFLDRVRFVGCGGLTLTDGMRLVIAVQACLLVVRRDPRAYDMLRSVLVYPDEFVVEEEDEDEAGVVTRGRRALSGQTLDTSSIVLSWRDVLAAGAEEGAYNVVVHEFAHYLDHSVDQALSVPDARAGSLADWHAVLQQEHARLREEVQRGAQTLIDPYGAEDLAELLAVATEVFLEEPRPMQQRHPSLYAQLRDFYGLDPARW